MKTFERNMRRASAVGALALALVMGFSTAQAAEKKVTYNLAAGANSKTITPAKDKPVLVIGAQTTVGNVGSSEVTLVNSTQDGELVWSGLESNGGGVTSGFTPSFGAHIIFIDFAHCVDLEVNDATSFIVHNGCGFSETGSVTLVY